MNYKYEKKSDASNSTMKDAKLIESPQVKLSLPAKWGFGERVVPEELADDPASQRILQMNLKNYGIAARHVSGKRVLDIACGAGYGSQILYNAGAKTVVGVDTCINTIKYAKQRYQATGMDFICADAEQFEWPEQFDVVVSFETIEHLYYPAKFLERIHNLLTAHGDFFLSAPLGETRHFDPYHLHSFTQAELFNLLDQAGFSVDLYRCDNLFLSRAELDRWKTSYPDAPQPSIRELLFTARGQQVIRDLVFRGGLQIPQLLINGRKAR